MNFDWNSSKTIQNLAKSGIPKDFESARFGILDKLLLSFLEIRKFSGTQFSGVHRRVGVDIFWNSQFEISIFMFVAASVLQDASMNNDANSIPNFW